MNKKDVEIMFDTWNSHAPQNPSKGGWFGSLRQSVDEAGQYYACAIEEYNDDGAIERIGGAEIRLPSMKYVEYYVA